MFTEIYTTKVEDDGRYAAAGARDTGLVPDKVWLTARLSCRTPWDDPGKKCTEKIKLSLRVEGHAEKEADIRNANRPRAERVN